MVHAFYGKRLGRFCFAAVVHLYSITLYCHSQSIFGESKVFPTQKCTILHSKTYRHFRRPKQQLFSIITHLKTDLGVPLDTVHLTKNQANSYREFFRVKMYMIHTKNGKGIFSTTFAMPTILGTTTIRQSSSHFQKSLFKRSRTGRTQH